MQTTLKANLFACAAIIFIGFSCSKKTVPTGWEYNEHRREYTTAAKTKLPKSIREKLENFVLIEGGTTTIGDRLQGRDTLSLLIAEQRVTLADFYLDKYEVTMGDYREFYNATGDITNKPDTLCFVKDLPYSYNDPFPGAYFWHPKYKPYPVCGVSFHQAQRYCEWKTAKINEELKAKGENDLKVTFRLPLAAELEYAMTHKTESYYFNAKNYLNIGNMGEIEDKNNVSIKNLSEDGYMWQAPVKSYEPNAAGIYNLHGNVAEWTLSTLPGTYTVDTTFRPNFRLHSRNEFAIPEDTAFIVPTKNAQKIFSDTSYYITKGGSFVHGLYYLQPGAFIPVKSDEQHAWLGFRMVMVITPILKE